MKMAVWGICLASFCPVWAQDKSVKNDDEHQKNVQQEQVKSACKIYSDQLLRLRKEEVELAKSSKKMLRTLLNESAEVKKANKALESTQQAYADASASHPDLKELFEQCQKAEANLVKAQASRDRIQINAALGAKTVAQQAYNKKRVELEDLKDFSKAITKARATHNDAVQKAIDGNPEMAKMVARKKALEKKRLRLETLIRQSTPHKADHHSGCGCEH